MRSPDESTDTPGVDTESPVSVPGEDAESSAPAVEEVREPAAPNEASSGSSPDEASAGSSPEEASGEPSPSDPEAAAGMVDEAETQSLDGVVAALARIEHGLGEYDRLLTRQTEVASRLHSENQELKKGELRQAQTSLVLGVIRVIDDITGMAETAEEATRADLLLIGAALTDALESHGVERLHVGVGDAFDGKAHKIARVDPTGDKSLARTVGGVARPGFVWVDGTVIRVADVVVYKFVPGHGSTREAGQEEVSGDSVADATTDPPRLEDPQE